MASKCAVDLPGFRVGDPPTATFDGILDPPAPADAVFQLLVIGLGTEWCEAYEYIDRVTFGTDAPGFRGRIFGSGMLLYVAVY